MSPPFKAVVSTPEPIGFVRMRMSPGFAPEFLNILLGWMKPFTARPYFGTSSLIVCPPQRMHPASLTLSEPPRKISPAILAGMHVGKQKRFNARRGSDPIA